MADYTAREDGRGITGTLGASADRIYVPAGLGPRPVEIVNHGTSDTMWARGDSTTAVAADDGADPILPLSFVEIDVDEGAYVSIVGTNGDAWSLRIIR